jgi:hypothetical protein
MVVVVRRVIDFNQGGGGDRRSAIVPDKAGQLLCHHLRPLWKQGLGRRDRQRRTAAPPQVSPRRDRLRAEQGQAIDSS